MTHRLHPNHEQAWDERAEEYAEQADRMEPMFRAATEALLDAVRAGPRVEILDLGCGPGHGADAARSRGAHVLGVDRSPVMIAAARARFPGTRFMVGDMLDPPAGPWDAIVSRFAAHHAKPTWLAAAFRVLRPGGRIALAETGPESGGPQRPSDGKREPLEWCRILEAAGFEGVTATRCQAPTRIVEPAGRKHGLADIWIIAGRCPADHAAGPGVAR